MQNNTLSILNILKLAEKLKFELAQTLEAKLAKALDNLEVQIQHNHSDFSSWEEIEYDLVYTKMDGPCSHDSFLRKLSNEVKTQAEDKMEKNGVDLQEIRQRISTRRGA